MLSNTLRMSVDGDLLDILRSTAAEGGGMREPQPFTSQARERSFSLKDIEMLQHR